ncbi:methylmalonyl-CoA mutase family protein [Telmatospirillum sp.]|uniref:methylmalonyl-CoA mutase family protein n=1 Tax=Telmatospirillum sp. TaxID=2079197 RepID=UPI002850F64C|nr:methylmalonyl-CoA mutase family protein [Telmatospirillum sp.]MDR3437592.1 methylmalonyl-CoA mutase family protein [Telmatospirillum sp.]
MDQEDLKLAADFPAITYEQWKKAVEEKELKGAPFEKKMVTKTPDGVDLQPLYVAENWPWEQDPSGFPGFFPYTRGTDAIERAHRGWDIRQEFREPDPKSANYEIRHDLSRGVTSVVVCLDEAARHGVAPTATKAPIGAGGVMIHDLAALEEALDGVDLAKVSVSLDAGAAFVPAALSLAAVWQKKGVAATAVAGEFGADPLGHLAATGSLPYSIENGFSQLGSLAAWTAKAFPKVRSVSVDTSPYHSAGASEVHDLAIALSTAVAYLKAMEAAGLSVDAAARQISFTLSVGCEEYLQIAKLRAARKLWAAVALACGASKDSAAMVLRAKSAERMYSRIDPWVNMLRNTVSTFAAAVGGADSVTSLPFDNAIGLPDSMGRRIARNTQVILMEESNLFRVVDPAGGAWSFESLTQQIAEKAWAFFQEIEAKGGIVECLKSGFLQQTIAATMAERDKSVAKRKIPLTGVSEFPNVLEKPVERPAPDLTEVIGRTKTRLTAGAKAAASRVGALGGSLAKLDDVRAALVGGAPFADIVTVGAGPAAKVTALPRRHLADSFERLRDAASAYKAKTGALPSIFLANLGPVAKHTGRATFSKNFFEAGGIQAIGNNGFADIESCVKAFKESKARIAVICSSDALYEEVVPTYAPALKAAGAETLYLAGSPGEKKETYDAAGIDDYIFMGGDVLGKLTAQLIRLGVIAK